jgi:hypothetical protein
MVLQRNKIIGFYIGHSKKEFNPDVVHSGINDFTFECTGFFIRVWGIGNVRSLVADNYFSLSLFKSEDLLDRNVVIRFDDEAITVENDWLGSIPVFYNPDECIISTLSNLCLTNNEIDLEGLSNYFDFGYSVFERTPFKSVKFLRYFSKAVLSADGLKIENKSDPILEAEFFAQESKEQDVIDLMQAYIAHIESKTQGDIVLPTSGGYDSRILNHLITDKSRIKSFTYGISKAQSDSYEVVYAKKISEILKTDWKQIQLNDFHQYIKDWFAIYGVSTHLHGMYHIEFYIKLLEKTRLDSPTFLSGIIGDAWSESGKFEQINNVGDITKLGYSHGMSLDKCNSNIETSNNLYSAYFNKFSRCLEDDRVKTVQAMRMKINLLSYLTQIPEYFGLPVWTPFLNFEIVKATLNIPESRRKDRIWQRDFFRKVGLNLEEMNLKSSKINRLNYEVARKSPLEPLNVGLMTPYVKKSRLIEINKMLSNQGLFDSAKNQLLFVPKVGGLLHHLGFKNNFLIALYEYYVIKSVEKGLSYVD